MRKLKSIFCLVLATILLSPIFLTVNGTENTYGEWSAWQTDPINSSDALEVQTRTVDITGTKTQYFYECWRYWNSSSGRYFYKGNGNSGGTYYNITLDNKLKYYSNTSDGASYLVGNGQFINFKGELWFNENVIQTPVVTGQRTEYRSRIIIKPTPPTPPTPTSTPQDLTPGIPVVSSDKTVYSIYEDIIISWTTSQNAVRYGLTIRKEPYSGDNNIVRNEANLIGNSINLGKLPAGNYRFAMRGYNSSGVGGDISNIIYFVVNNDQFGPPEVKLDKKKYLSSDKINMTWDNVPGAVSYTMHIKGGIINGSANGITGTNWWFQVKIPGVYQIWGTSLNKNSSSNDSAKTPITVSDALIYPQPATIVKGYTQQFSVHYANEYTGSRKPKWSSSNNNIATVDSNGKVTARSEGTASISISIGGKKIDSLEVKVPNFAPMGKEKPDLNNEYYKAARNVLPWKSGNCTTYAWGRAYEITGRPLPDGGIGAFRHDAIKWLDANKQLNTIGSGFKYGLEPKVGSIAVWGVGGNGNYKNNGHVAIVEKIEGDVVYISQSNYDGPEYEYISFNKHEPSKRNSRDFLGYIYLFEPID